MKFALMTLAAGVGLGAFANIVTAPAPFDYNTANAAQRQAWMRGKAERLNDQARFYAPEGSETAGTAFFMNSVESDVMGREMRLRIDVHAPEGAELGAVSAADLRARLCALSSQTGLRAQGVTLTAIYADQEDDRQIMRGRARPQDCA